MKLALLAPAFLALCCTFAHAEGDPEPKPDAPPKELVEQVERLVNLLSDSFATGYPEATMVQTVEITPEQQLTLAVFTVEGFDMGNSYNQYLAVFELSANEEGEVHYRLIDQMQIGGDMFRAIQELKASASKDPKTHTITFSIPALANTADDSPNFPSQPVVISVALVNDRLVEVQPQGERP